jgi:diamine N-acetyltransferase
VTESVFPVTLRPVTRANWVDCIGLAVAPEQRKFVAANAVSLAQAAYEPECTPLAVYADETMVGFVMYAHDQDDGNWWIYRLMTDAQHQGKGYGRAALQLAISHVRQQPGCDKIVISIEPGNDAARRLYESEGFRATGEVIGGEDVLVLHSTIAR